MNIKDLFIIVVLLTILISHTVFARGLLGNLLKLPLYLTGQQNNSSQQKDKQIKAYQESIQKQLNELTKDKTDNERIGLSHDKNFIISAPSEKIANYVLKKSNLLRNQIALEWLGEEIPPSIGQTIVHVEIASQREGCLTWPKDNPARNYHLVWIYCPEKDIDSALTHEITHTVLETKYPNKQFPNWAQEAIATINDTNQQRDKIRNQVLG